MRIRITLERPDREIRVRRPRAATIIAWAVILFMIAVTIQAIIDHT